MNVGTADIQSALARPDDEAITRAFEHMEKALAAWTQAVVAISEQFSRQEAALSEPKATQAERSSGVSADAISTSTPFPSPGSPADPVAIKELRSDADVAAAGPSERIEDLRIPMDPEAADVAPSVERAEELTEPTERPTENAIEPEPMVSAPAKRPETFAEIEAMLAKLTPDKAEAVRARHAFFKGQKTYAELIQELEDEADDEESLLMSLDPELARTVRVKYRLYNGRKTLREVIAEVEAASQTPKQPDKKSWWRRSG